MTWRPYLAVDIDDVLAAYSDAFLRFVAEQGLVVHKEHVVGSFIEMGIEPHHFADFQAAGKLRHLAPLDGAQAAIDRLRPYFQLIAIASRPVETQQDTQVWIERYFPYMQDIWFTPDKGAICRGLGVWGLIDDQVRFAEQFKRSFVLAQPWNQCWTGTRGDWPTLTRILVQYARNYFKEGNYR